MSSYDTVVLDGEMGLFTTVVQGDLPYYTGATEVTPSNATQTLPTAETIVMNNIVVNPIPDAEYQSKSVTPTESAQTVTADAGYDALSSVEVGAISSTYVGSAVPQRSGSDLTTSGAAVTAPAGFYAEDATASIASGSASTPATTITANPSVSVSNSGLVTASVSATQSVTPSVTAGYVDSGSAGTITVSGSGSAQLSTQAAATITPSTTQQTAVAAGKFTTGAVIVDAMPSGTAGTPTATKGTVSNHSVSVTPSVTNQTGYITGGTKTGTAVTVSASELVSGNKAITANGTGIDVTEYATVSVAVPGDTPTLQTKSVSYTPTESQQTASVTADSGYDGLDQVNVTVGAIDSEYVGSDITRRSSSDLTASGATVTAPAGYYGSAASKTIASGSATTPATSITANPTISVSSSGLITATASASQNVTPSVSAGYVSSGTAGTVSVSGSATEQLSTQAAATITPTTSSQTAVAANTYTTGAVTVAAIPSEYVIPTGTLSITDNGTGIDVSEYAAVDVSVSGGSSSEDAILQRTLSGSYTNSNITKLTNALCYQTAVTSISLPNLTNGLNNELFRGCTNLTSLYVPKLSGAASSMNYGMANTKLINFALPGWKTQLGNRIFNGCTSLIAADFVCRAFGGDVFYGCTSLTTIILRKSDALVTVSSTTFGSSPIASGGAGCTIYIPKVFYDCLGDSSSSDYKAATNWSTYDGYGTITWACIEGSQYENYYADGTAVTS